MSPLNSHGRKTTLIVLGSTAVVLGIITYITVFDFPPASYGPSSEIMGSNNGSTSFALSSSSVPSWGASTTSGGVSGSPLATSSMGAISPDPNAFATTFNAPYPLTWSEGNDTISITAIAFQNNQLSFTLAVKMGNAPECIPMNLRRIADESGTLQPPTPSLFSFPDSGTCEGSPHTTYTNQPFNFDVGQAQLPLLFTTGGTSNIFFEVATTTGNGLQINLPSHSG